MPNRKCIFCKKVDEKKNLIRIAKLCGKLVVDKKQKINSRGIYFCNNEKCIKEFVRLSSKKKNTINFNCDLDELVDLLKTIN